jgi:phospholipid/cholesterol/gamma-HCH transport system substrate-binding protein
MRIQLTTLARLRLAVVGVFVLACLSFLAWMLSFTGVPVPFFGTGRHYAVSVDVPTVRNLVPVADVHIAGVPVGDVAAITDTGTAGQRLHLELDPDVAPLHTGATIRVSEKSLAGQYYVDVVDGTGPALPTGTMLPPSSVLPAVDLTDILASFDVPTRAALHGVIGSLGTGTEGREREVGALVDGLSQLGRGGFDALDAVAAQSDDLSRLSTELQTVFTAADTNRGQIAQVVADANRITAATAGQRPALEAGLRRLPGVLTATRTATEDLTTLSRSLSPIASDLHQAAPALNDALRQLPDTTASLRALLPPLNATLARAPATLHRVPTLATDLHALLPPATDLLRDLNPALRYLHPYGLDTAQFFANFAAGMNHPTEDGLIYAPLQAVENPYALRPNPLRLPTGILAGENAYPAPGSLTHRDSRGPFTRLRRDN